MIVFKNVTKKYDKKIGVENINIQINDGEFVFLVGPSGAGKSTFIKLLTKELEPDAGEIFIDGTDITHLSRRQIPILRRRLGMIFQDFRLLQNKNVYQNIAFAMEVLHKSKRRIKTIVPQVLELVRLTGKEKQLPQNLSQGEQQRVAIARAIVNKPKIILADEPTGNLDPDTSLDILSLLNTLNGRKTTILMVTHEKEIVDRMAKRVVRIENGHIVSDSLEGVYSSDV